MGGTTDERPVDVFISYSSADVAAATALEHALTAKGKKVFRDKAGANDNQGSTGLKPGEHIANALPAVLLHAKTVVVIWSDASSKSEWVKTEASYAAIEGKLATLHIPPFKPSTLGSIFSGSHSEPLADTLASLDNLLQRIADLSDPAKRKDGLDDDVIDARLADPVFRKRLNSSTTGGAGMRGQALQKFAMLESALTGSGYKPLDETPIKEQRNDARNFIKQTEGTKDKDEDDTASIDPSDIPDELVEQMLVDEKFREMLDGMLEKAGVPKLMSMDADEQRVAARAMIAAMQKANAKDEENGKADDGEADEVPALPDAVVTTMLADRAIRATLTKLYSDNDIDVPYDKIPREMHAKLLAKLVADGVIDIKNEVPPVPPSPPSRPAILAAVPTPPPPRGGILRRMFGGLMRGGK